MTGITTSTTRPRPASAGVPPGPEGSVAVQPAGGGPGDAARAGDGLTAKGRRTRQHIVAVAAGRIHAYGVAATTLDDVRAEAGVSSSQLYHYFADKRALVHAVVDSQLAAVLGRVTGADLTSAVGWRVWREGVVGHLERTEARGGCPIGSLAAALAETDETARLALAAGFAAWESVFREGLAALAARGELPGGADPAALATTLLAVVQGGYLLAQLQRDARPMVVAVDTLLGLVGVSAAG